MVKRFILLIILGMASLYMQAQPGEDPSTAFSYTLIQYDSIQITGCPNNYSLGASASAYGSSAITGTMANDVWFKFVALATVVKVKVCSPTSFDAGVELWNSNVAGTDVTTRKDSLNSFGSGQKEYKCMGGLIVGNNYFLRVGRVSGSGSGNFGLSVEHNKAIVNPNSILTPCATFTNTLTRNWLPVASSTHFQIFQGSTLITTVTAGANISLGTISGLCMGATYSVYVEVSTNDAECGLIWWGYSTPYTLNMCACMPVSIQSPACGSTISFSTVMNATYQGSGVEYQWRFTTNNGNVQICTEWSTSLGVFSPFNSSISNCLRYNKIYSVQVRARKAPCTEATCWSTACNYFIPPMPLSVVSLPGISCGQYMSLNDGFITASTYLGADQWRFKFAPVDPCTCTPIGPAITTPWLNSYVIVPVEYLQPGVIYNVQAQWRILPENCVGCNGNVLIHGQQTDWAPGCCMIGINIGNSPPDGTSVTQGCFSPGGGASMQEWPDDNQAEEEKINMQLFRQGGSLFVDLEENIVSENFELSIYDIQGRLVHWQKFQGNSEAGVFYLDNADRFKHGIYIVSVYANGRAARRKVFLGD